MLLLLPSATTIVLLLSWTCSHSIVLQGVRGGRVGLDAHLSSRRTRGRQEQQRGHSTELKVGISSSYTAAEKEDLEIEVRLPYIPCDTCARACVVYVFAYGNMTFIGAIIIITFRSRVAVFVLLIRTFALR